jgi:PAS domain S-box-containing protein
MELLLKGEVTPDYLLTGLVAAMFVGGMVVALTDFYFEHLAQLRKNNDIRFQNIINNALDAVVQMDAEGVLLDWNHQAELTFGWTTAEVRGRLLHDMIIPERFREAHRLGLKNFLVTRESSMLNKRIEIMALHRDGREFPIELAITSNQLEDNVKFSAFVRDISLQKQAIQTLQRSEERYRALFNSSRDALMTLSPVRGFLSGNAAAIILFACKDEQDFLSQNPVSLSPERQADGSLSKDSARKKIEQAYAEGSIAFEWLHRRLNGEIFSAEVQLNRVVIEHDTLLQATVRDITERKRFQAALIESEARIRKVLRTMSDAVALIDAQGKILLVNDSIIDLFGYREDELQGQNVKILMPEPYYSKYDGYLKLLAETEKRVIIGRRIEVQGKRKNGQLVPIELTVNELPDDFGSVFIGVMRDISQRKAFEQLQETARREAERLAHAKSEFLANMSHEIRTPLNAVIGLAKMNVRTDHAQSLRENSVRIHEAALHLLDIVNDILDFSKIEAGKMTLDLHPFKLMALVNDVVGLVELRAKEKQLNLVIEHPEGLPEWVMGDSLRLRQILVNLLSNAIKFTEYGHVSLTITSLNDTIEFSVADSGIGMSEEQISRLFTAFEQADNSTTRKFGGSGLGLAISRHLAQIMGGDISVYSTLGLGSRFVLRLPLPETKADIHRQNISRQEGPRLQGISVLVAEDVELNRIVLEDLLTHEGAQVVFAENGQQALDRLEETGYSEFDLVLMDIQMPVMDGYQTTRRILKYAPNLPIIGLTAHAMPEERQRCLEAGMRDRVTKPIDADILVAAILQNTLAKRLAVDINPDKQTQAITTEYSVISEEKDRQAIKPIRMIDWPAVLQRYGKQEALIDKLVNNALSGTHQENIEKLRQAAAQRDKAAINFIAHNVKGLAGAFGSRQLLDQVEQIELAEANNQQENTALLGEQLAGTMEGLLAELLDYRRTKY